MGEDQVRTACAAGRGDLLDLADALRALADRVRDDDGRPAMQELVRIAVDRVPGARWASLTLQRGHHFGTEACSDATAERADLLRHESGCGPAVEAGADERVFVTGDLAADERCAAWGRRVRDELGISSVLSQQLTMLGEADVAAALNIYSDRPDAFDDHAVAMGLVLASHASLLTSAALARGRAAHLGRALASNREIGVAMGILMQRHHIGRDEAFDLLRKVSQDSNRKLSAVASDVADTGILASGRWQVPHPQETRAL